MVSSEADRCPLCRTDREGIRGAECKVCLGLLKISEATYHNNNYFYNSCYKKISKIVERKKTINCPVCQQPNHVSFSHGYNTNNSRNYRGIIPQICAKCGHPYAYQPIAKDEPYSSCIYCELPLENSLEVQIIDLDMPTKFVIIMQGKSGNFRVKNGVRNGGKNRGKKKYVTVRKKR